MISIHALRSHDSSTVDVYIINIQDRKHLAPVLGDLYSILAFGSAVPDLGAYSRVR